jgi:hypothetical protein
MSRSPIRIDKPKQFSCSNKQNKQQAPFSAINIVFTHSDWTIFENSPKKNQAIGVACFCKKIKNNTKDRVFIFKSVIRFTAGLWLEKTA